MSDRRHFLTRLDMRGGIVEMAHGAGGRAMTQLVEELFMRHFDNPLLRQGNDQAVFGPPAGRLAVSTDGHVITPLFFPGGDIGALSVHGSVNDIAMGGARPLYMSAGFILEEGLPLADLERIVKSMAAAARECGIRIVTGDTKVVGRGQCDGVFITTTAIGEVPPGLDLSPAAIRPGDAILISGHVGDHGVAILSRRESLEFETEIRSDTMPLHDLVADMVRAVPQIRCMRDPTRGGVAATLNEIAATAGVGMRLNEEAIPVRPQVRAACELLGLDPLNVANEGKLIAFCPPQEAERLLKVMRAHPKGRDAAIIGEVTEDDARLVTMRTSFGGERVVDWLAAEQLPRIC